MDTQMSARKNRQKLGLFNRQDGKCYYCGCQMVLPGGHTPNKPDNLATLEHLDDKWSPDRGERPGEFRRVLACNKCNHERNESRQREAGKDERRKRSESGHSPA